MPSILEALAALDVEDDAHWTSDGAPRLEVVSQLAGEQITRDDIKKVAPKFSRKTPETPETQKAPNAAAELDSAKAEHKQAAQKLSEAQRAHDAVVKEQEAEQAKTSDAEMIKAFQKSQAEQRAKQAKASEALKKLVSEQGEF